jgi:hypothetical protein
MAFFDTGSNPFEGMNIFSAKQPEYLGGLLTQEQQDKLKNQSLLSGLLSAGATYLAQPKNQNIGLGAILGKTYLGGMQGAQGVYNAAAENEMQKMKIAKEQRDAQLDYLKAIPSDVREYEYAQKQGYGGTFQDWAKEQANLKAPKTTIQMPNPTKEILEVDKKTLEGLVSSTNSARSIANQTRNIDAAIGNAGGSGVIKLSADVQNYLGIKSPEANVNQLVNAIATKGATEIRTPGSGSTSDLEFGAYRSAFPTLATSQEGRQLMVKIANANANRNAKLTDWARRNVQAGTFSYEGLGAYDDSLGQAVSDDIKKQVEALQAKSSKSNVTPSLSSQGQSVFQLYRPKLNPQGN